MMDYSPPLDRLLTLGEPKRNILEGPGYARYGISKEHVPELARMATDMELNASWSDTLEVWAPLHAWRALAELAPLAALDAMLSAYKAFLEEDLEVDWLEDDLLTFSSSMGASAIPALERYLDDATLGDARLVAAEAIGDIGSRHRDQRESCVAILMHSLQDFRRNGDALNGMIIVGLVALEAIEAAPLIEQAFAAHKVDSSLPGSWEWVQYDLGLREDEPDSQRYDFLAPVTHAATAAPALKRTEHVKLQAKRKSQRQAKKKNRKKRR